MSGEARSNKRRRMTRRGQWRAITVSDGDDEEDSGMIFDVISAFCSLENHLGWTPRGRVSFFFF